MPLSIGLRLPACALGACLLCVASVSAQEAEQQKAAAPPAGIAD